MSSTTQRAIVSTKMNRHSLIVEWRDGSCSEFHYLWLRDNCSSVLHEKTKERVFDLLSVSENIHPIQLKVNDNTLDIVWSEGDHISTYEISWLLAHSYSRAQDVKGVSRYQSWDASFLNDLPYADYQQVMEQDSALYQWMLTLDKYGLTIIKGLPNTAEATTKLATRIDYLRQTNFGTTFNVESVESPINLAYTSIPLPLHTDLPNQETPPGYQFLHCLANDCEGGESVFVDGLRVAEELKEQAFEHFSLLSKQAIPFRFHDSEHDIREHHTVINVDHFGNIIEIKYNAHLADIFDLPAELMHEYYLAYRDLMSRLRDKRFKIEFKLQAGQMAVFDNRRVLHGRNRFENDSGRRHLHGCYVDRTEFKSRLRVLGQQQAERA